MSIICVSGLPGGGKTTLAKAVSENLAINYGSFGDFVRHCATLRHISAERASLQELGQSLVASGARKFCDSVLTWLNWTETRDLILDGLRHQVVLDALIELVRPVPVRLLFVEVSPAAQFSRLLQRGGELESSALMADATERDVQSVLRTRAELIVNGDESLASAVAQVSAWFLGHRMRHGRE